MACVNCKWKSLVNYPPMFLGNLAQLYGQNFKEEKWFMKGLIPLQNYWWYFKSLHFMTLGWLQETQQVLWQALFLNQNQTSNYCTTESGNQWEMDFGVLWISQMILRFTGYLMILSPFLLWYKHSFFRKLVKNLWQKFPEYRKQEITFLAQKSAFLSLYSALCLRSPSIRALTLCIWFLLYYLLHSLWWYESTFFSTPVFL